MHKSILDATIAKVRQRESEGDCPLTPAYSVEHLEHALLSLAKKKPISDWAEVFKHNLGTSNLHEVVADFIAQNQGPSPVPALMEALTTASERFAEIREAAVPGEIAYHNEATINGIHANAAVAEAEMADALTALHMGLKTDG